MPLIKPRTEAEKCLSLAIISEIGAKALARYCQLTPASVTNWKKNGIPPSWMMFIRVSLPNLRAFGGTGIPGVSKAMRAAK